MSSLTKASSSPQKVSENCLSPWMVDNLTTHLECRPPRVTRWEQKKIDNFSMLSARSLPVLNSKELNYSKLIKSTRTIGTQTFPSSCESIELNEKDHEKYYSLAQITNTNPYNRRSSDAGPTDWHQLGKELRQIADELKIAEKIRSSSTQSLSNLGSSPDSGKSLHLLQYNKSIDYLQPRSISACRSLNDLLHSSRKK